MNITSIAMAMSISTFALATDYPRFEALMSNNYEWKAYEVITSDGYILTTFNIPVSKHADNYKGEILIQHTDEDDGASWIEN